MPDAAQLGAGSGGNCLHALHGATSMRWHEPLSQLSPEPHATAVPHVPFESHLSTELPDTHRVVPAEQLPVHCA